MKRKVLYLLQCVVMIVLSACSEDDLQSLQAAFESNVQEVTMGESVTFKEASIGEPTKWNWHFDGGEPETSVLFSPSVVYNKPGVYSVILSVGRGSNVNEIVKEQNITVNYPSQITANFSADKTTATNEDIISFKDLSKGYPNEWLWSFTPKEGGEIITSTEQNPQMMLKELFQSGMNVGRDMMGTMTNTLILAFTGGSINTLVFIFAYNYEYQQVINMYSVGIEIMQGLSSSLGVIIAVPVTSWIAAFLYSKNQK